MSRVFEALMQVGRRPAAGEDSDRSTLEALLGPSYDAVFQADARLASSLPAGPADEAEFLSHEASVPVLVAEEEERGPVRVVAARLDPALPLFPSGAHKAIEQYRMIRTKLLHHSSKPKLVAVSSPDVGDGKSTTALNLGWGLSKMADTRVLVADLDFRRSSIAQALSIPGSPGLAEVLLGNCRLGEAVVRLEGHPGLHVLPAGETCGSSSELLASAAWASTVKEMREQFDYVIADCPPVGVVADSELIVKACDGVVLVLRPDHTPRETCYRALETLKGGKLIGVVLNRVTDWFLWKQKSYARYYSEPERPGPGGGRER